MKPKDRVLFLASLLFGAVCFTGFIFLFLQMTKGSYLWVMDEGDGLNQWYLTKLCSNGRKKVMIQFGQSGAIGVDPRNGDVWAPELNTQQSVHVNQIVKIGANWNITDRYSGYRTDVIAVDPNDGSVWVGLPNEQQLLKLDEKGQPMLQVAGFPSPASIMVDARDSSIWVADYHPPAQLAHLTANGEELFRTTTAGFFSNAPHQLAIDPRNGNVWYSASDGTLNKLSASGELLHSVDGFDRPTSISINPKDGSVWVADFSVDRAGHVVAISPEGEVLRTIRLENPPRLVAFDPSHKVVWAGMEGGLVKLSQDGKILMAVNGLANPYSIAMIPGPSGLLARIRFMVDCH